MANLKPKAPNKTPNKKINYKMTYLLDQPTNLPTMCNSPKVMPCWWLAMLQPPKIIRVIMNYETCSISSQQKLSYDNLHDVANVDFNAKCRKMDNRDSATKVSLEENSKGRFPLLFMFLCFIAHLPVPPHVGALQC